MTDLGSWIVKNYIELGGFTGAMIAAYIAKTKGYLTIGRPTDRRRCPDKVIGAVEGFCDRHEKLESTVDEIKTTVDEIAKSVSNIAGFLQGKNGYHG